VIDSHTHLDRGPAPEAELVAAARAAGVKKLLTIGIDARSRRAALAAADEHEEVYAALGHHPNNATGYDDATTEDVRELAKHPRCLAIGETGLDDYRKYAPRADQERAPWQLAKDEEKAGELDETLRSLAEGLRVVTVMLTPYIPESAEKLLAALGTPDTSLETATYGALPGGAQVEKLPPLFPKP